MSFGVQNIWYIVKIQLKTENLTCNIITNTTNLESRSESLYALAAYSTSGIYFPQTNSRSITLSIWMQFWGLRGGCQ